MSGLNWVSISSLATAGGTLVLAVATFGSVKSANRAARAAERSLLAGLRPVLVPSRDDDPEEHVLFGDGQAIAVPPHAGVIEAVDGSVYMALTVRNAGNGLAVMHGWRARVFDRSQGNTRPELDEFRAQQLDLYLPSGDAGFWQGAVRDVRARGPGTDRHPGAGTDRRLRVRLTDGSRTTNERSRNKGALGRTRKQLAASAWSLEFVAG